MTSTDGVTSSPFARNFLRKSHFDAINSNEVAGSDEKWVWWRNESDYTGSKPSLADVMFNV